MKIKTFCRFTLILNLLFVTSIFHFLNAQYFEVPLERIISQSSRIVEGEIIESESFISSDGIYTSNKLRIYKNIYNANTFLQEEDYVYIITRGGKVDGNLDHWSHALRLYVGQVGLFMLSNTQHPTLNDDYTNFEIYAEKQGFTGYYLDDNRNFIGKSLFVKYDSPEELIEKIYDATGQNFPQVSSFIREDWEIHYKLDNFQFNGSIVNFEVYMKSKWGNIFSVNDISFKFKYDADVFGQNILSNPNTQIQIANEFNQNLQLSTNQLSTNEGRIKLQSSSLNNAEYFSQEYRKLLEIRIPIENLNLSSEPYFELLLEEGEESQLFADQSGGSTPFTSKIVILK